MTSKPAPSPAAPEALGRVLLPLRAFLGFTFCFAGLQKLANPQFFDAARRSPVDALTSPLTHVAIPLGILIALGELAVGVGTLLGLRARLAAAGGLVLSLMLFLTVSFHSAPYYTGADIVFAFAWPPLLLAGSGSVLSLDAAIKDWVGQQAAAARRQARRSGAAAPEVHRREVLLRGMTAAAVAAVSLVVGGLAAGLGRLAGVTAGAMQENATPCAVSTARAAIRSYSPPGWMGELQAHVNEPALLLQGSHRPARHPPDPPAPGRNRDPNPARTSANGLLHGATRPPGTWFTG